MGTTFDEGIERVLKKKQLQKKQGAYSKAEHANGSGNDRQQSLLPISPLQFASTFVIVRKRFAGENRVGGFQN